MCHLWDVTHWHWVSRTEEGQAFAKQSVFFRGRNIATDYMTWITFDSIMPPYMLAQHLMHWSSLSLEPQDITVTQVLFMLATERQIMGEGREKAALLVDEFARYHFYNIEQLNRDATERFCLRSICFHRDLWFAEFIFIFMHFVACIFSILHDHSEWWKENWEEAESQFAYLAGHSLVLKLHMLPSSTPQLFHFTSGARTGPGPHCLGLPRAGLIYQTES